MSKSPINLLRSSNFHSLVQTEGAGSTHTVDDKIHGFLNFLSEKVQNEEVSSYAKFTLGFFSQSIVNLNTQIEKLKSQEHHQSKEAEMRLKELELDLKEQRFANKKKDEKVKDLENQMKLQSYDLLVENNSLIKENSSLKKKMVEMERTIQLLAYQ